MPQPDRQRYPERTILLHNLARVLDRDLQPSLRLESMKLAARTGQEDPAIRQQLAGVLDEPGLPDTFRNSVLEFLLQRDYPELAGHVVKLLPELEANTQLRQATLEWLSRHGGPEVLAAVVKLWAEEEPGGPSEPRFRLVVQRISGGTPWDEAILAALNDEGFSARGSGIAVLQARVEPATLKRRLLAMDAETPSMGALKRFISWFDYVPADGEEFVAVAILDSQHRDRLPATAKLYNTWKDQFGYSFNVRDFHLISRLAADPLWSNRPRRQVVRDIAAALKARKHISRATGGAAPGYEEDFWVNQDKLSIADLWNLMLVNNLLGRRRVQVALGIMADRDRADRTQPWGGLVFYEQGQAEAKIYPADATQGGDLLYVPTDMTRRHLRDALCLFHGHFESADNRLRAGPDKEEMRLAREGNYYGLVLTSVDKDHFAAHYYTPGGTVISLGVFPFGG